jgi:hypothetical protein
MLRRTVLDVKRLEHVRSVDKRHVSNEQWLDSADKLLRRQGEEQHLEQGKEAHLRQRKRLRQRDRLQQRNRPEQGKEARLRQRDRLQ